MLLLGHFLDNFYIYSIGMFSFAGGITNWLAIKMIFRKIPLLYGSGVIQNNFENIKLGIKDVIINQIIDKNLLNNENSKNKIINNLKESIINELNYDKLFERFKEIIKKSSFSGVIDMMGGDDILNKLKPSFNDNIALIIEDIILSTDLNKIYNGFEVIIDDSVDKLTPLMVEKIIEDIIYKYMYWLVIWGNLIGALMGIVNILFNI